MQDNSQGAIVVAALRLHVLFAIFHGHPRTWSEFLLTKGSLRQIENDLPFVLTLEDVSPDRLEELAQAYKLLRRIANAA